MRWFISDLHFFHKNVIRLCNRPFSSLEEMHEVLITNWNKRVHKKDIVYVLGDFSFGQYDETKEILNRLNGRKILIRGNHDNDFTSKDFIDMGFEDVRDFLFIKINSTKFLLSHYPYRAPWYRILYAKLIRRYYKKEYFNYFLPNLGEWHLHGHIHRGLNIKGKEINVCVDINNFTPISETEIYEKTKTKT